MGYKFTTSKILIMCLGVTFILACIIASIPIPTEPLISRANYKFGRHKLAVLVPFRDRFEELLDFVPHITNFLNGQKIDHHVFILHQRDNYRFNRAALINVGFLYTRRDFDYIAMHDVDLLPLNKNLSYSYPAKGPFHLSSPELHPRYHYATFIGGILLIKREHFELVDGMSNKYWGWGLEDDEFYVRLKAAQLSITRPTNITTGIQDTFKHFHDKAYRRRDMRKCFNQYEETRKRDRKTGLHNVEYELLNKNDLTVDKIPFTVLNIKLVCDQTVTPWCLCPEPTNAKTKTSNTNKKKS